MTEYNEILSRKVIEAQKRQLDQQLAYIDRLTKERDEYAAIVIEMREMEAKRASMIRFDAELLARKNAVIIRLVAAARSIYDAMRVALDQYEMDYSGITEEIRANFIGYYQRNARFDIPEFQKRLKGSNDGSSESNAQ